MKRNEVRRLIAAYPDIYWKNEEGDYIGSNTQLGIVVYDRDGWVVAEVDSNGIEASGMDPDDPVVAVRCALRNLEQKKVPQ